MSQEKKFKYHTEIETEHYNISISIATDSEQQLSDITQQFARITVNGIE